MHKDLAYSGADAVILLVDASYDFAEVAAITIKL